MEAAHKPHLRVIDGLTGEIHEDVCEECLAKDRRFTRLQKSYEGTIAALKEQLADKRADDKKLDPMIVRVVEDWCRKAEASGVWKSLPKVTDPRIDATRTAMNKGHDPAYLMVVNTGAFIAVSTDRQVKPQWLEPTAIYGKFIDAHFQTALSPSNAKLRKLLEAPQALLERWVAIEPLADPCDHCQHARLDHDKPAIANDFTEGPCLIHGCGCPGFDDFDLRTERWVAARSPKPRFRP